jgi:hypothetical protein
LTRLFVNGNGFDELAHLDSPDTGRTVNPLKLSHRTRACACSFSRDVLAQNA